MKTLISLKKNNQYLAIICFETQKRLLYLQPHSAIESNILEKWQSGRMRQS